MKKVVLMLVFIVLLAGFAFGELECSVKSNCDSSEVAIIHLNRMNNAHGYLTEGDKTTNVLCCSGTGIGTDCGDNNVNAVLWLNRNNNAHASIDNSLGSQNMVNMVKLGSNNIYTVPVCISGVECEYEDIPLQPQNAENDGYTFVIGLNRAYNAHLYGNGYLVRGNNSLGTEDNIGKRLYCKERLFSLTASQQASLFFFENCTNGIDDNNNNLIDCGDQYCNQKLGVLFDEKGCLLSEGCVCNYQSEEVCNDGFDNDADSGDVIACIPNEKKCYSSSEVMKCSPDGSGYSYSSCSLNNHQHCQNGECVSDNDDSPTSSVVYDQQEAEVGSQSEDTTDTSATKIPQMDTPPPSTTSKTESPVTPGSGSKLPTIPTNSASIVLGADCKDTDCIGEIGPNGHICCLSSSTCQRGSTCINNECRETSCGDVADNDQDGEIDCADPDCDKKACADSSICYQGNCIKAEEAGFAEGQALITATSKYTDLFNDLLANCQIVKREGNCRTVCGNKKSFFGEGYGMNVCTCC